MTRKQAYDETGLVLVLDPKQMTNLPLQRSDSRAQWQTIATIELENLKQMANLRVHYGPSGSARERAGTRWRRVQPRQTDAVDHFVVREADGYKAEGFMSMPMMNRNEESSLSLPGITSVPRGVPLQRSDGRVQWQNPCDTKRLSSLLMPVIPLIYTARCKTAEHSSCVRISVDLSAPGREM